MRSMVLAMTLHYGKAFFIAGDYVMVPKGLLCVNKGRGERDKQVSYCRVAYGWRQGFMELLSDKP